jgi:hypothetical protein
LFDNGISGLIRELTSHVGPILKLTSHVGSVCELTNHVGPVASDRHLWFIDFEQACRIIGLRSQKNVCQALITGQLQAVGGPLLI